MQSFYIAADSISIQYGPHLRRMVAGVFECRADKEPDLVTSDSESVTGSFAGDSDTLLEFVRTNLEKLKKYDIILLNSGLHDIRFNPKDQTHQVELDRYESNLRTAIKALQKVGVYPWWVTTTPVDDARHNALVPEFERHDADVVAYNKVAVSVANDRQIPVIDLYTFTRNLWPDVYADNVHFTEEVKALQAAFIAGNLMGLAGPD